MPQSVVPLFVKLNSFPDRMQCRNIQFTSLALAMCMVFFIQLDGANGFAFYKYLITCVSERLDIVEFTFIADSDFYSELFHVGTTSSGRISWGRMLKLLCA
jgi:hypothetical protein